MTCTEAPGGGGLAAQHVVPIHSQSAGRGLGDALFLSWASESGEAWHLSQELSERGLGRYHKSQGQGRVASAPYIRSPNRIDSCQQAVDESRCHGHGQRCAEAKDEGADGVVQHPNQKHRLAPDVVRDRPATTQAGGSKLEQRNQKHPWTGSCAKPVRTEGFPSPLMRCSTRRRGREALPFWCWHCGQGQSIGPCAQVRSARFWHERRRCQPPPPDQGLPQGAPGRRLALAPHPRKHRPSMPHAA